MNLQDIPPVYGWILLIAILAAPPVTRLVKTLYKAWRIRQRIKSTPGPLLGVVYPDRFNKPTNEDTGR